MLSLNKIILNDLDNILSQNISFSKLKNKTVLITGAGGFIASYLVYTLLHLNDTKHFNIKLLALVRNTEKAKKIFKNNHNRDDLVFIESDVCTKITYPDSIDFIIHAASMASPSQFVSDPVGTISANTLGTLNMLKTAKEKKSLGFLFLSTREIYGKNENQKDFLSETDYGSFDPTLVRSCYPESKRMAETLCASYMAQHSVPCKISRIAHTYGPSMTIGDGRVVGDFIKNVVNSENICLNSDGSAVLGLTYISDLIAGLFMQMLDFPDFVYNISNDSEIISVKDLAVCLCDLFKEKNLQAIFKKIDEKSKSGYLAHKVGLLSSEKARAAGFKTNVDIKNGFLRTIKYFETEKNLS